MFCLNKKKLLEVDYLMGGIDKGMVLCIVITDTNLISFRFL